MKPEDAAKALDPERFVSERQIAMQRAVLLAEAASKKRTPVKTGTLRRSETSRVEQDGLIGRIGTNLNYAPLIHARVPFFALGIDDARAKIIDAFAQAGERFFAQVEDA